jgi:hypothetical protein
MDKRSDIVSTEMTLNQGKLRGYLITWFKKHDYQPSGFVIFVAIVLSLGLAFLGIAAITIKPLGGAATYAFGLSPSDILGFSILFFCAIVFTIGGWVASHSTAFDKSMGFGQ